MQERADLETGVAIVGGGIAGLSLALQLHAAGMPFQLFEARPRLGGRIAALTVGTGRVDLGPSWFWPGQPRMAALVQSLDLRVFDQHAKGAICLEEADGTVHRGLGYASMEGSYRVDGGMIGLVEGFRARLPADRLHLSCPAVRVEVGAVTLADGRRCGARHVVLALPPRLAAGLGFAPDLPKAALDTLAAIPTWMAAHAKFVAVYDRPFWREAGLSGDAMSRRGPLVEVHDASGADGAPAALFGFVGVSAPARAGRAAQITEAALTQLARIFGEAATQPLACDLRDWADDPLTATAADQAPLTSHPHYGLPAALDGMWSGRLHFASTETAPEMGGYLEGALASAERVARRVLADPAARG